MRVGIRVAVGVGVRVREVTIRHRVQKSHTGDPLAVYEAAEEKHLLWGGLFCPLNETRYLAWGQCPVFFYWGA